MFRTIIIVSLPWLALALYLRWYYRDLLRSAVVSMDIVFHNLPPGMARVELGETLSDLGARGFRSHLYDNPALPPHPRGKDNG